MKLAPAPDWRFLEQPPFSVFEPIVRARLAARAVFPGPPELSKLARRMPCDGGFPFEFAAQVQSELEAAGGFDRLIASSARIPTRASSYHDLLGALVWLHFPKSKTALHRIQLSGAAQRGAPENAATHLDESGVLVLSCDPSVFAALTALQWRELFWDRRKELSLSTRFLGFGHGLLDSLRAPHPKLMGKALLLRLNANTLTLADSELRLFVDRALALRLSKYLLEPSRLFPLPVLGIPGWSSEQSGQYYANGDYFRTQRQRPRTARELEWLDLE